MIVAGELAPAVVAGTSSLVVALIVAGPTWVGIRRATKKNTDEHHENADTLGLVVELVRECRDWQEQHTKEATAEREAVQLGLASFLEANPALAVPEAVAELLVP